MDPTTKSTLATTTLAWINGDATFSNKVANNATKQGLRQYITGHENQKDDFYMEMGKAILKIKPNDPKNKEIQRLLNSYNKTLNSKEGTHNAKILSEIKHRIAKTVKTTLQETDLNTKEIILAGINGYVKSHAAEGEDLMVEIAKIAVNPKNQKDEGTQLIKNIFDKAVSTASKVEEDLASEAFGKFEDMVEASKKSTSFALTGEYPEDSWLEVIAEELPNIETLDLTFSFNITDTGLKNISNMNKLKYLFLDSCNKLTDEGLNNISKLKSLEVLDLSGCREITNDGLSALTGLENLRSVVLDNCSVGVEGISALLESLPNLESISITKNEGLDEDTVNMLKTSYPNISITVSEPEEIPDFPPPGLNFGKIL